METNEVRLEAQDLNQQAVMLLRAEKKEEAKAKLDRAIELDPMLMDSYKNYGDLYMKLEEYQNAKNSYKKAMLIEKNGALHFLYGNACFMNDEVHEGLESYNMAIIEGYDSDEMMFFMGMAYEYLQDNKMALRYFQKACAKNPSRPDYLIKKISVMLRLDMSESAKEAVEELLKTAPEMYDGYHLKTQMLLQENLKEEAIAFAKSASERFPEDADLLFDYAQAVALSGSLDEAVKLIESAKQMKYFEDAKRKFSLLEAQIFAEKGKIENALVCCDECLELEPDGELDGEVRFMRLNLNLALTEYDKALAEAERIIRKKEEDSYYYAALYYKPFCLRQMQKTQEAQKFYKEAISLYRLATLKKPEAVDLYLYRAMCLKDMEEYDKALEMLDFISGLNDEIAEIYVIRADIYHIQGRKKMGDEQLEKAYQLKPELRPVSESAGE